MKGLANDNYHYVSMQVNKSAGRVLNQARKDNTPVIIHLTNGFQLRGRNKGFDNFTVLLEHADALTLVEEMTKPTLI